MGRPAASAQLSYTYDRVQVVVRYMYVVGIHIERAGLIERHVSYLDRQTDRPEQ